MFNNTLPARIIYSITTFDHPPRIDYYDLTELVPARSPVVLSLASSFAAEFGMDEWANALESASPEVSSLLALSSTESLYYLRIDQIGEVLLDQRMIKMGIQSA